MKVIRSYLDATERDAMSRRAGIEGYRRALAEMVGVGKVRCSKYGNEKDFMVNEIGHVFCNVCYAKIPMLDLDEKI